MLLLLFIGITWVQYFESQANSLANALAMESTREEFTNNKGYSFLALFPLLLMWNTKPLLQYILFIICIGGIILSMKRGAIIIAIPCAIYFIYSTLKTSYGKTKFAIIILSCLTIMVAISIVENMLATSDYFVYRLESTLDGDSSNRDIIYSNLWDTFINEPNPFIILFGRGANATLTVGPNYAHNDWLEIITNQGLLGIVIYLCYFAALFKDVRQVEKTNKTFSNVLTMSLLILFSRTLFSMSYNAISITLSLAIGLALARPNTSKNNVTLTSRHR